MAYSTVGRGSAEIIELPNGFENATGNIFIVRRQ
jgi:hypothetical protein